MTFLSNINRCLSIHTPLLLQPLIHLSFYLLSMAMPRGRTSKEERRCLFNNMAHRRWFHRPRAMVQTQLSMPKTQHIPSCCRMHRARLYPVLLRVLRKPSLQTALVRFIVPSL